MGKWALALGLWLSFAGGASAQQYVTDLPEVQLRPQHLPLLEAYREHERNRRIWSATVGSVSLALAVPLMVLGNRGDIEDHTVRQERMAGAAAPFGGVLIGTVAGTLGLHLGRRWRASERSERMRALSWYRDRKSIMFSAGFTTVMAGAGAAVWLFAKDPFAQGTGAGLTGAATLLLSRAISEWVQDRRLRRRAKARALQQLSAAPAPSQG